MDAKIKEFVNYRYLLWSFVTRNIAIKYKQTVMGFVWAVFMPIVIVLSGVMVRQAMSILAGTKLDFSQVVSVSVKALPWAFFVSAIKFAVGSLTANMNLVSKIYFPRAIFPLSYVFGALFDFVISALAFSVIFLIAGIGLSVHILWLPVYLILLILLTSGLSMLLACGNLFFRDVRYIVDVILTFGIFFTPVFYEASLFGRFESWLLLNPVGAILEGINDIVVLHKEPDYFWFLYAATCSILCFIGSWNVFQKYESKFAEYI